MACKFSKPYDCLHCTIPEKTQPGGYCEKLVKAAQEQAAWSGGETPQLSFPLSCQPSSMVTSTALMQGPVAGFKEIITALLDRDWIAAKQRYDIAAQTAGTQDPIKRTTLLKCGTLPCAGFTVKTALGEYTIGETTALDPLTMGMQDLVMLHNSVHLTKDVYVLIVTDISQLARLAVKCQKKGRVIFDVETFGLQPRHPSFEWCSTGFGFHGSKFIYYVPVNHHEVDVLGRSARVDTQLTLQSTLPYMDSIFSTEEIGKVGHNLKFETKTLAVNGIDLRGIVNDTQLALFCLDSRNTEKVGLKTVEKQRYGIEREDFEDVTAQYDNDYRKVPIRKAAVYNGWDIYSTLLLDVDTQQMMHDAPERLQKIYTGIDLPIIKPLAKMELTGIKVDPDLIAKYTSEEEAKLKEAQARLTEQLGGREINVGSHTELAKLLYQELKICTPEQWHEWNLKINGTGLPSTGAGDLQIVLRETGNEILETIMEIRRAKTYINTFLVPTPGRLIKGILYGDYNAAVAVSSRLSSSNPNLQNLPTKCTFKEALIPRKPGNKLVVSDWSQIELKLFAVLANIRKMIEAYQIGADLHQATGDAVFPATWTPERRRKAGKTLNFGVVYGMSEIGFSKKAGCSVEEAKQYLKAYHETYPEIDVYYQTIKAHVRAHGYSETYFGRPRHFDPSYFNLRAAVNHTIQGTAADYMRILLADAFREFRLDRMVRMCLTIHDELILEAPDDMAEDVAARLTKIMTFAFGLLTITCDTKILDNIRK